MPHISFSRYGDFQLNRIRPEIPRDYVAVETLTEQAFGQTAEAEVVRRVRNESAFNPLSLVAVRDQTVIGHVLFSKVFLTGAKTSQLLLGLGPVSIHPEHQRQGIGSALIRDGLSTCESRGSLACFVLGNPAYYQRFGFQNAYQAGFWFKKDADNAAFQVIFWGNADQDLPRSEVRYAEAFNLAD